MFKSFKNLFNREGHQHHHRHCGGIHSSGTPHCEIKFPEDSIPLDEVPEEKRITVVANSDLKTMEMGLYPGSIVTLVHNDPGERNIIVKIHDQRYVVPREIARMIFVKNK